MLLPKLHHDFSSESIFRLEQKFENDVFRRILWNRERISNDIYDFELYFAFQEILNFLDLYITNQKCLLLIERQIPNHRSKHQKWHNDL